MVEQERGDPHLVLQSDHLADAARANSPEVSECYGLSSRLMMPEQLPTVPVERGHQALLSYLGLVSFAEVFFYD